MLKIRREAELDIKEAYAWYEDQRFNLGKSFVAEVEAKLEDIEENPELHGKVYANVRRALCKRFPYSLYFIKTDQDVVIIGVLHQRRNPSAWQARV